MKHYVYYVVCIVSIACSFEYIQSKEKKRFVIVTASYNNKDWLQKNLESILSQDYECYRLIYINDASNDGTKEMVTDFFSKKNAWDKVTFLSNDYRRGHLENQYNAIEFLCDNDEIVVIVDGDDWLAHDHVLSYLNDIYQDPEVWMTYGQFWYWKKNFRGICRPIPKDTMRHNAIRSYSYPSWILSHLRTFYAGLFKMIKKEDLFHQGAFFKMCADVATMIPMAEMAGEHIRFISDILLIYNDGNSLSFFQKNRVEQARLHKEIAKKEVYQRLTGPIFLQSNNF